MKELIDRLVAEGLTEEQAQKALEVIKNFAAEKFPMFAGAINNMFDKSNVQDENDFLE
jgi:uncharacterized UBP type Zn finger protein